MKQVIILLCFALNLSFTSKGQTYEIGHTVQNFELQDVQTDSLWNLNQANASKGIVLIFDANECAYSRYYRQRILELHRNYEPQGFQFVLINSFNPKMAPKESKERMLMMAKANHYPYPYLRDRGGKLARKFGARKAPECYVLERSGERYKLRYKGAVDDNPQMPEDVGEAYLKDALEALLAGKTPSTPETFSVGCMIRK